MESAQLKLWNKYQRAYEQHNDSSENIEELHRIIEDGKFDSFIDELGVRSAANPRAAVKKRIRELIKENDEAQRICDRKMTKLGKQLHEHGISVDAFHAHEALKEAVNHHEESWRKECDAHLDTIRPCTRIIDNVEQRVPLGASGCKTTAGDDDENEEVDILDPDDDDNASQDSELSGIGKINYFNDSDDAKDIEEASKTNDMAIKIGTSFLRPDFAALLKPHQREAVIAILKQLGSNEEGFLLAHAMGLGKSLSTICVLQALSRGIKKAKFLVLCPKSLLNSWYSELDKWDSNITFTYYPPVEDDKMNGISYWSKKGGLLIMTHDRFRRYQLDGTFSFNPDVVVVDEAHNLKNSKNLFYQAVLSTPTKRKLLLTGTPLQNHLMEYYTMLNLISPSLFDETTFKTEYAQVIDKGAMGDAEEEDITAAKTKIKVFTRLTEGFVHRRSVAVLQHALPPMTDLKLTYTVDDLPDMTGMGGFEKTYAIATAAKDTKISLAKKLIKSIRKTGDFTLIFSKSKEVVEAMSKKLGGMLMMTGATSSAERRSLVDSFMSGKSGYTEFCMTTQVGGLGLNLQKANRIIILDPTWNPVIDRQACFRAYRYGQTKPVFIYRFIVDDSIEERIYRCAVHKSLAACRVIDEQDVERLFTKAQLNTKDDFEENVLDPSSINDRALKDVVSNFNCISQHDVLFAEASHEKLSDEELADADNEYNKIIYGGTSRPLTHPKSQLQLNVGMDELFFPVDDADDELFLVPPTVPVWKRTGKNHYDLLQLLPASDAVDEYVIELEMTSPSKGIATRSTRITPAMNQYKVFHTLKNKGICRIRAKMVASSIESEWSDWSAIMYA